MSKYDQCEHRLHCGTCIKTGKICPHLSAEIRQDEVTPWVDPLPDLDWTRYQVRNIPDCCVNCLNHPTNGGSGICNCVLPYMNTTNGISYNIVNNNDGTYTAGSSQSYNGNSTVTIPYKDSQTEYDPEIPYTYTSIKE